MTFAEWWNSEDAEWARENIRFFAFRHVAAQAWEAAEQSERARTEQRIHALEAALDGYVPVTTTDPPPDRRRVECLFRGVATRSNLGWSQETAANNPVLWRPRRKLRSFEP